MGLITLHAGALLFDMDGTLVDSRAVVEHAWRIWSERYGLRLEEVLAYSHGRPTLATMEHFGQHIDAARDWRGEADEMQALESSQTQTTHPIAGAAELLAQLDGVKWAVVTSAPRDLAESRISAAGLPLPRVLVPADEISRGKPDPEGYLKAARELGCAPAQCIVFEDTPPGIEAGLAAGMQVVGLLTTVPAERLRTTNLIEDFRNAQVEVEAGRLAFKFARPGS